MSAPLPHLRPGLFRRKWQDAGEPVHPVPEPYVPDRPPVIIFNRPVDDVAELIALCPPAKLALGAKKRKDGAVTMIGGGLGPGWGYVARHGAGWDPESGRFGESVALKLAHGDGRSALFVWARPVPDPRLMVAVTRQLAACGPRWHWVPFAVLAALPAPGWKAAGAWRWTRGADGRPEDIPARPGSAAVKKEVQS